MGIGVSLLLIAAGAILIWAVEGTVSGIDVATLGWILGVVGIVGIFVSLVVWGFPRSSRERERVIVDR